MIQSAIVDFECFAPSCTALLLRELTEPDAPLPYVALARGVFIIWAADVCIETSNSKVTSAAAGENVVRGVFYMREILVNDGTPYPVPRVGDILALSINREVTSGFRVLAAGGDSGNVGISLASDELILDFCPALASIASLRVHIENPSALRNQPLRRES